MTGLRENIIKKIFSTADPAIIVYIGGTMDKKVAKVVRDTAGDLASVIESYAGSKVNAVKENFSAESLASVEDQRAALVEAISESFSKIAQATLTYAGEQLRQHIEDEHTP